MNFLLELIVDLLFRILGELLIGTLIRLPGILLTRWLHLESDSNPDGCFVLLVGAAFWALAGLGLWWLLRRL